MQVACEWSHVCAEARKTANTSSLSHHDRLIAGGEPKQIVEAERELPP